MKPSPGYLIPITSAEDLKTSLQIQTQTIDQISRSSAESFRCVAGNPNSDVRQDVLISRGTGFIHLHDLFHSLNDHLFLNNASAQLFLLLPGTSRSCRPEEVF